MSTIIELFYGPLDWFGSVEGIDFVEVSELFKGTRSVESIRYTVGSDFLFIKYLVYRRY